MRERRGGRLKARERGGGEPRAKGRHGRPSISRPVLRSFPSAGKSSGASLEHGRCRGREKSPVTVRKKRAVLFAKCDALAPTMRVRLQLIAFILALPPCFPLLGYLDLINL